MKCGHRALTLLSLMFGLLATGALALAIATDYWLHTKEPYTPDHEMLQPPMDPSLLEEMPLYPDGLDPDLNYTNGGDYIDDTYDGAYDDYFSMPNPMFIIHVHSGLWRACTVFEGFEVPEGSPADCKGIAYNDMGERVSDQDTTFSILRAMRNASPVFVFSLVLSITAFALATIGNAKRDFKTISGAVLYIFSALVLAVAVILYISAVNDEISQRKKPSGSGEPQFEYSYGWAFYCAGGAFVCSMMASVANISAYLKRFPRLEDMVIIIPGLHSKSNYDFSKVCSEDELETTGMGSQNPTIIL